MLEWPLPGATGTMGAVSPSHDDARSAGSTPLHRQPVAPPGDQFGDQHVIQSQSQNDGSLVSSWSRGPPIAIPVEQSVDTNSRPVRCQAVGIGRGMRVDNMRSMADAIQPGCIPASHGRSSTLAKDPPGGDTRPTNRPREGARPLLHSPSPTTDPRAYDDRYHVPRASHGPRPDRDYSPVPPTDPHDPYHAPHRPVRVHHAPHVPAHQHTGGQFPVRSHDPSGGTHYTVPPVYRAPSGDVQYSAPQYSAPQYSAPQYSAPQYRAPQLTHRARTDCIPSDYSPAPLGQEFELSHRIPAHVEPKTAYKALNGEFVQLETFLDCNANEYEAVEYDMDSQLRSYRPRRMITSLYKWMQAWGHYEVTLVSRYGLEMYYELASYRSFILSLTDKYKVPFILTYDERHRAALGRTRSFDFTFFNHQLFVTIFDVNSLRTSSKCAKCASLEHNSKDCPFRGAAPTGGVTNQSGADKGRTGRQNIDPDEVCIRFQDGTCKFKKCPRKHCCLLCGGPNGAKSCGNCAGKARTTTTS